MASRTTITLTQAAHCYPIRIGKGGLSETGSFLSEVLPQTRRVLVVTDSHVGPLYLETIINSLEGEGFTVETAVIAPGEDYKTMETLEGLYDKALAFSLKRNDTIVAFGGGIVGDITGLFAATYMRGIPFIQVPTTLLAQVDSSVGGKVAVNWRHFKNLIGAFNHPYGVLIDTTTLESLPEREFACGMAEVIKYGFLERSAPGFQQENSLLTLLQRPKTAVLADLELVIERCCRIKGAVVEADPEERRGIREILNLGHTFAHAYEAITNGEIPHGEAVSMGMVDAFRLSSALGQIDPDTIETVKDLLQRFSLPINFTGKSSPTSVLETMLKDKKVLADRKLRLVLPYDTLGKVRVQEDIPAEVVMHVLEACKV